MKSGSFLNALEHIQIFFVSKAIQSPTFLLNPVLCYVVLTYPETGPTGYAFQATPDKYMLQIALLTGKVFAITVAFGCQGKKYAIEPERDRWLENCRL